MFNIFEELPLLFSIAAVSFHIPTKAGFSNLILSYNERWPRHLHFMQRISKNKYSNHVPWYLWARIGEHVSLPDRECVWHSLVSDIHMEPEAYIPLTCTAYLGSLVFPGTREQESLVFLSVLQPFALNSRSLPRFQLNHQQGSCQSCFRHKKKHSERRHRFF